MIGDRFREMRVASGDTQEQAAVHLGISRPQVTNIEAGRSWPSLDVIIQACDSYDVSADWLLEMGERTLAEERLAALVKENETLRARLGAVQNTLRLLTAQARGYDEP